MLYECIAVLFEPAVIKGSFFGLLNQHVRVDGQRPLVGQELVDSGWVEEGDLKCMCLRVQIELDVFCLPLA